MICAMTGFQRRENAPAIYALGHITKLLNGPLRKILLPRELPELPGTSGTESYGTK
jgi:hypothetical protein